ncbi:MAG: type II toxin-antitoxin system PemK/MazF family toxin [Rhodospirillales bacterium]|nr:type II toxin-antitoxin system PemK/MazF family toxin [Rhodospirillales bacterium]
MKRGEIWTVAAGKGYAGKPRPAVIIQDDRFDATASVTLAIFTTDTTEAPLFRLRIEPSPANGLRDSSHLMVDKVVTVARQSLGKRIGELDDADRVRLDRSLLVFLGLAGRRP